MLSADRLAGLWVWLGPSALGLCSGSGYRIPLLSALAIVNQIHNLPTTHCLPGAPEREMVRKAAGGVATINSQLLCLPRIFQAVVKKPQWGLFPFLPNRNETGGLIMIRVKIKLNGIVFLTLLNVYVYILYVHIYRYWDWQLIIIYKAYRKVILIFLHLNSKI